MKERRPLAAGVAYFVLIFILGFLLGVLRTMVLVPVAGSLLAVAIELPLILGASWLVCRRLISAFNVAPAVASRAIMGGSGLLLLLIAELGLSISLLQNSVAEHFRHYATPAGALGLCGQLAFGALPLLLLRAAGRSAEAAGDESLPDR